MGRKRLTFEQFYEKARMIHNDEYEYFPNTYQDYYTKLPIKCKIHGIFYKSPHEHLTKKRGCEKCAREKRAKELIERKAKEFFTKAEKIHDKKYIYTESTYQGSKIPIDIICSIHGKFSQLPNDHLNGHGCSKCNQSSLERNIKSFLIENNIKFEEQSKINKESKLKLDFYLPQYNIAIECQGEQHFRSIEHFGGENEFQKIKDRDIRKFNLCKENNIKLIYFTNKGDKIPDIQIYNDKNFFNDKEKLLKEIYL